MHIIEITDSAIEDLADVFEYTFENFGDAQYQNYKTIIDQNVAQLGKNPFIGHSRKDIPNECLAWKVGHHYFIYRVSSFNIFLLRVLHEKMDFTFQF